MILLATIALSLLIHLLGIWLLKYLPVPRSERFGNPVDVDILAPAHREPAARPPGRKGRTAVRAMRAPVPPLATPRDRGQQQPAERSHEKTMAPNDKIAMAKPSVSITAPPQDTRNPSQAGPLDLMPRESDLTGVLSSETPPSAGDGAGRLGTEENPLPFETSDFRFASYMSKVKRQVEMVWQYPYAAQMNRLEGNAIIKFTIAADGSLQRAELLRSSGSAMLDQAALRALHDGSLYPPLPKHFGLDALTVIGTFRYRLTSFGGP